MVTKYFWVVVYRYIDIYLYVYVHYLNIQGSAKKLIGWLRYSHGCDQMFIFQNRHLPVHTLQSVFQCLYLINQKSHQQQIGCHHVKLSAHPHIFIVPFSSFCVCGEVYSSLSFSLCIYIGYNVVCYIHKIKVLNISDRAYEIKVRIT